MERENEEREDKCVCVQKVVEVMWSSTERVPGRWQKNVSKIRSSQSAWRSVGRKRLSVSHGAEAIVRKTNSEKAKGSQ
jgi:hypothetical protein